MDSKTKIYLPILAEDEVFLLKSNTYTLLKTMRIKFLWGAGAERK